MQRIDEVTRLCPKERYPLSLRVGLEHIFVASYSPQDVVQKYEKGHFPNAERFVLLDGTKKSFKKALPVFAARVALSLAKENGLILPDENDASEKGGGGGGGGPSAATAAAEAAEAAPDNQHHERVGKRGREEELYDTLEEALEDLYDGDVVDAADAERVPDEDAAAIVETVVWKDEMAAGWEPELWTQEHLKEVQDLANCRRPPSTALQASLIKQCTRSVSCSQDVQNVCLAVLQRGTCQILLCLQR